MLQLQFAQCLLMSPTSPTSANWQLPYQPGPCLSFLLVQLEVVEPGTVLMWIFGSILALLWLLFVFYGESSAISSMVQYAIPDVRQD